MTNFTSYTVDTAPEGARALLQGLEGAFGLVPNLQAYMAESPELLAGYTALFDQLSRSTLSPTERHVVYFTANFEYDCRYCMAGHTAMARRENIDPVVVEGLRAGTPLPDLRLEALRRFATEVVRQRGAVSGAAAAEFVAAGFTTRNMFEVILAVAMKTITHLTSQLTRTPLDDFMLDYEWAKPVPAPEDVRAR